MADCGTGAPFLIVYTASIKIRNCYPDFCYIRRESEIHKSFVKILLNN